MQKRHLKYSFGALLIIITMMIIAFDVSAQSHHDNSSGKEVAFSFYKTANAVPNFERWIKSSHPYLSTPQAKSEQVLKEQKSLMWNQFSKFNPEQYPVRLNLKVKIELHPTTEEENNVLNVHYEFADKETGDLPFFPFEYAGDHFAVVIQDFENWQNVEMPIDRFAFMQGHLNADRQVTVAMELIPRSADINNPFDVNDVPHWLMSAELGSFITYSATGVQLYSYTAPWYFSPIAEEIGGLKSIQQEIAKDLDIDIDPILMPVPTND